MRGTVALVESGTEQASLNRAVPAVLAAPEPEVARVPLGAGSVGLSPARSSVAHCSALLEYARMGRMNTHISTVCGCSACGAVCKSQCAYVQCDVNFVAHWCGH